MPETIVFGFVALIGSKFLWFCFHSLFTGKIPGALLSPCQEEEPEYVFPFANWKLLCYVPSLKGRNNNAALDFAKGRKTPAKRK